jgi:hypothetical protein
MRRVIIKTKQIEVPIYGSYVTFIYSNSYDAIVEYAKTDKRTEEDIDYLKTNDYEGLHMPLSSGCYYLIIKKNKDKYEEIDTITHEVSHLVTDILHDSGVKVNRKNDEAYAYLTGYLNKEFFKFKDSK